MFASSLYAFTSDRDWQSYLGLLKMFLHWDCFRYTLFHFQSGCVQCNNSRKVGFEKLSKNCPHLANSCEMKYACISCLTILASFIANVLRRLWKCTLWILFFWMVCMHFACTVIAWSLSLCHFEWNELFNIHREINCELSSLIQIHPTKVKIEPHLIELYYVE